MTKSVAGNIDDAMGVCQRGGLAADEILYRLLKALADKPAAHQRELARRLDISLGKLNYCLRALVEKGLVKIENFHRSPNKRRYLYKLTPRGLAEKARVTIRFLRSKLAEFEHLQAELAELRKEAASEGYLDDSSIPLARAAEE